MVEDGRKTRTSLAAMGEIKTTDQLTFRNTVLLGLEPSASFINGSAAVRISRMRRQQQDHLRTASKYIRNCVALTWEIVFICLFQYCSDLIIVLLYTTRLQPYSSHLNHLQHCIHIHYLKKKSIFCIASDPGNVADFNLAAGYLVSAGPRGCHTTRTAADCL